MGQTAVAHDVQPFACCGVATKNQNEIWNAIHSHKRLIAMDQNSLYELAAEYGEVYGVALPRDSYLLKTVDDPEHWLDISDIIGPERAQLLAKGDDSPDQTELTAMIRWQVDYALTIADTSVTPIIWLCTISDTGSVIAVESWDDSLDVELKFRLIGKYQSKALAIDDLDKHYIFEPCDI